MAFQKAVKGSILIGGGAVATVFGLSQFSQYRKKHCYQTLQKKGVVSTNPGCDRTK